MKVLVLRSRLPVRRQHPPPARRSLLEPSASTGASAPLRAHPRTVLLGRPVSGLRGCLLAGVRGCLLAGLLASAPGCTDPVEDAHQEGASQPGADRTEARNAGAPPAPRGAGTTTRERRTSSPTAPDTVAADVAAGLADGGMDEEPPTVPAPATSSETGAAAGAGAPTPPSSEPSEYIRPVIQDEFLEGVRILRFALAEDVIEREPVMISSRFRHNSGPMHVFLEVANQTADDVTLLVGFRRASDQRRGGGVSLTVPPSPRYRTRARANTRRAPGEWVCEVMDERQRVLVTQRFFIVPDPNAATATTDE